MQKRDVRWPCCMPKDAVQGLSPKSAIEDESLAFLGEHCTVQWW